MEEKQQKQYILAVDDEPKNLELIAARLSSKGYRLVTAESGKQALERIRKEKPALVLLDIMMPEMDGVEVLKQIKAIDKDIPVAMVTAVWDNAEGKKCMDLGAYEYVTKPIDFNYLETAVFIKLLPDL